MSTKHTSGPWAVLDCRAEEAECLTICAPHLGPAKPFVIARVQNLVREGPLVEEDEANARLIAAAPELLEALKKVKTCSASLNSDVLDLVKEAIDKAEGGA